MIAYIFQGAGGHVKKDVAMYTHTSDAQCGYGGSGIGRGEGTWGLEGKG